MGDELNRGELISLLERLGDDADERAIEAARTIHQRVTSTGVTWDELLVPEGVDEPGEDPDDDLDEDEDEDIGLGPEEGAPLEQSKDEGTPLEQGKHAVALALIDDLLARDISETAREELLGYREDIAEGEFDGSDLTYLRALGARLTKR
jgi:hypothetical protein